MAKAIGIDLGTTNSVVAYLDRGQPVVIPNAGGNPLTPSVVAFAGDSSTCVGQIARAQAIANPDKTVFSIKRKMGSDHLVRVDGREYLPQDISAMILQDLKRSAENYLGEEVKKAVITVPAYFNDRQRNATKDAGTLAGLDVIRIINEPTSAALAYGLDREDVHTILVWDLGGGTFDVSILELGDGVFEVKAVNGDTALGGDDYDQRLMEYLAEVFHREYGIDLLHGGKRVVQELKEDAEKAKIKLSEQVATIVRLPLMAVDGSGSKSPTVKLTQAEFEGITEDLRQRMVGPTMQAMTDAKVHPDDIDRVILVGGATRMPAVQRLIRTLTGKEPYGHIDPDKVVALGAAIQAGILTGEIQEVVLVDVNPLSLGVETLGGIFSRIIERNTPIPTSQGQIFTTAADGQTAVDIHILQGERDMAEDNVTLGQFQLGGIPPQPRGTPRIEVTFSIDANGIVNVSAHDLMTEEESMITISSIGRLTEEEIQAWIREAGLHEEEDRQRRERVELNIRAESMISAAEHVLRETEEAGLMALPAGTMDEVEQATLQVKEALASGDSGAIARQTERLTKQVEHLHRAVRGRKIADVIDEGIQRDR